MTLAAFFVMQFVLLIVPVCGGNEWWAGILMAAVLVGYTVLIFRWALAMKRESDASGKSMQKYPYSVWREPEE